MKKILLLLWVSISLYLVISLVSQQWKHNEERTILNYTSYRIDQTYIDSFQNSDVIEPYIGTHPQNWKYPLTVVKELYEVTKHRYDDLFIASKRMEEIKYWGTDLKPSQSVSSWKQSLTFVKHYEERLWRIFLTKNWDTWDIVLARYYSHIEKAIRNIQTPDDALKIYALLQKHKIEINKFCKKNNYTTQYSSYANVHDSLLQLLKKYIPRNNTNSYWIKSIVDTSSLKGSLSIYTKTNPKDIKTSLEVGIGNKKIVTKIIPPYPITVLKNIHINRNDIVHHWYIELPQSIASDTIAIEYSYTAQQGYTLVSSIIGLHKVFIVWFAILIMLVVAVRIPRNRIGALIHHLRKLFFHLSLLFLLSVFIYKEGAEILLTFFSIFWVFTIIGYSVSSYHGLVGGAIICTIPFLYNPITNSFVERLSAIAFILILSGNISLIHNGKRSLRSVFIENYPRQALSKGVVILNSIKQIACIIYTYTLHLFYFLQSHIYEAITFTQKKPYKALLLLLLFTIELIYAITMIHRLYTAHRYYKTVQVRNALDPHILQYEPAIVYPGTKVVIHGTNFDWKQTNTVALLHNNQPLQSDEWTDRKIIFSIPIGWSAGTYDMYITRKILWEGTYIVAKSSNFDIQVLPISHTFTASDEAFYNQVQYLSDETKKLNGL